MIEGSTLFGHIMKIWQLWILLKEFLLYEAISIFKIFIFFIDLISCMKSFLLFSPSFTIYNICKKEFSFSDILHNTVKLCQITKGQLPHRPEIPKLFPDQSYRPNLTDLRPVGGVQLKKMRTLMLKSEWSTRETGTCKLLFNLPQVNSQKIIPNSGSFLRRQLMIANYRVKKFVRKSQ